MRHKGVRGGNDGDPDGAEDEDEALAVDVGDAAPEEEETAKGEHVGRDDPLLATLGHVELGADGGQDDDDALHGQCLEGVECEHGRLEPRGKSTVSACVQKGSARQRRDEGDASGLGEGQRARGLGSLVSISIVIVGHTRQAADAGGPAHSRIPIPGSSRWMACFRHHSCCMYAASKQTPNRRSLNQDKTAPWYWVMNRKIQGLGLPSCNCRLL